MGPCTAVANPNIAFIKYWGNRDDIMRLPVNGSISMNLDGLESRTTVQFDPVLKTDKVIINGKIALGTALDRVVRILDEVRSKSGLHAFARVESENNFPTGTGIASSASAFAALAVASSSAAGLKLNSDDLSRLARHGSGSACRSIPAGFVEWTAGTGDSDSFAKSIAPPWHWDLVDCIALISSDHKTTGSSEGHSLAWTSPLQQARVEDAPRRLDNCLQAILKRDFSALAEIVETDSNLMHAVMMTSSPPLFYWQPATLDVIQTVRKERSMGLAVCYSIDAGPNVHVICTEADQEKTTNLLGKIPGVLEVIKARVGGAARLIENSSIGQD